MRPLPFGSGPGASGPAHGARSPFGNFAPAPQRRESLLLSATLR